MHTGLIQRIERQRAAIGDPENAVRLANWLADVFADVAPVGDTHTLIRNLTVVGELRVVRDGVYEIGVGEGAGSPDDKAPPHTISDFLAAHNEFRTRKRGVPSPLAWKLLSEAGKELLQREREAGRFGGESGVGAGRSPYMWVQDASTEGGAAGAAKAGINPQRFLEIALEAFSRHVPEYVREIMR